MSPTPPSTATGANGAYEQKSSVDVLVAASQSHAEWWWPPEATSDGT